jgi:polysaccharide biosynthesis protein PslH
MTGSAPRLLVLANRLPYPVDDGWKTRTYHLLRGLVREGPVTLLTFHGGSRSDVARMCDSIAGDLDVVTVPPPPSHTPLRLLLGLVTRTPVYVWNMKSREYEAELRRQVERLQPRVIVSELTYMFPYLRGLAGGATTVIDTHNVDSVVLRRYSRTLRGPLRRLYARMTAGKLRGFERDVFEEADVVWVCSDAEAAIVHEIAPRACVVTVPNGVDTTALAPLEGIEPDPLRLLFFGRLDYAPNRDAIEYYVEAILPRLRELAPGVRLDVVGAGNAEPLRRLTREMEDVRIVGRVDDLRPVLASAAAVVVPLRMGGGTRLKILEAMSAARPIISTTVGAEGLDVVSGRELILADTPADLAAAIARVTSSPGEAQRLGEAARSTARRLYDWQSINARAADSIRSVTAGSRD